MLSQSRRTKDRVAAIFDCDGVLVDSEQLSREAWRLALAEHGIRSSHRVLRRLTGASADQVVRALVGRRRLAVTRDRLKRRKLALYLELAERQLRPRRGVKVLLRRLQAAGWRLAVASSGRRSKLQFNLTHTNLAAYFEATVGIERVRRGKPAPDLFRAAARALRLPPERCIVFEDSPLGIAAAQRAHMKTVGVLGTFGRPALRHADTIISDLSRLLPSQLRQLIRSSSPAHR